MTDNLPMITWLTGGRAKSEPRAPDFFHQNTDHRIHRSAAIETQVKIIGS